MGALQRVLLQILTRLRDVSISQRIALLLGGALVAVSLIWLAQWAARPEMVPLLEQDLQAEELAQVRGGLEAVGEKLEVRGNRIYVTPAANRQALLARLQQDGKLPANTSAGFAALVKESNPWITGEESNRRWTYALQKEIETVLRQFQGVKSASVFLNLNTQSQRFTKLPPPSSASVTLVMKDGQAVPRPLALAAARLVSGAVAGLPARNVHVLDAGGRAALDWEGEQDPTNALANQRLKLEQHYSENIRGIIPDPRALVRVQVELNPTASSTWKETPLAGVPQSEETLTETTTRVRRGEEPGVRPNVAIAAGGGGADESQSKETTSSQFQTGRETKTEATPAGEVRLVTAAISLSSSYLEEVHRRTNPDAGLPSDAQLEEVFQKERSRLIPQVARLIKPQSEDNVAISRYYDSAVQPLAAAAPGALDEALQAARKYGPQSGLGLLALLALGLMLKMGKKSDTGDVFGLELGLPEEAIEAARQAAQDMGKIGTRPHRPRPAAAPPAAAGERALAVPTGPEQVLEGTTTLPVGQAAVTEGVLVAQEVDAMAVQTRKMLDQVAAMVDTDAEVVSALLEQWVQRSDQYREGG